MAGIDQYTKLYLAGGEANLSTTIIDSELAPTKTGTCNGTCHASTLQNKFTSSSLLVAGGYLQYNDDPDWDLGTGDFSVEGWINYIATGTNQEFCSRADADFRIIANNNSGNTFVIFSGSSFHITAWAPSTGTWYFFAWTRSGTNLDLWIDGTKTGTTATCSTDLTYTTPLYLGQDEGAGNNLNGYIAGFRWSKGIARWSANFTPPTDVYTVSVSSFLPRMTLMGVG